MLYGSENLTNIPCWIPETQLFYGDREMKIKKYQNPFSSSFTVIDG